MIYLSLAWGLPVVAREGLSTWHADVRSMYPKAFKYGPVWCWKNEVRVSYTMYIPIQFKLWSWKFDFLITSRDSSHASVRQKYQKLTILFRNIADILEFQNVEYWNNKSRVIRFFFIFKFTFHVYFCLNCSILKIGNFWNFDSFTNCRILKIL